MLPTWTRRCGASACGIWDWHWAKITVDGTARAWSAIAPRLAGMTALAGGFVLMLSATTPMDAGRRVLLEQFIPLPFVEASHFLSSIVGAVMIIVANGLLRRVYAAWWMAVLLAGGGVIFSLLKGFDWEEALVLCVFLGELRAISDAWLVHHQAGEKGFSLGRFDAGYLCRLPVAVIIVNGRAVAFGNVWPGNGKSELSTDLMRHFPDAPNGVMDCLFVQLMLWGKQQGYQWFDLGMAPLSGLAARQFAPLWNRIGGLIYARGEAFYHFTGLRAWKSKFQPVWQPRYLALSKAWDLPAVILDITTLIGKSSFRPQQPRPGQEPGITHGAGSPPSIPP